MENCDIWTFSLWNDAITSHVYTGNYVSMKIYLYRYFYVARCICFWINGINYWKKYKIRMKGVGMGVKNRIIVIFWYNLSLILIWIHFSTNQFISTRTSNDRYNKLIEIEFLIISRLLIPTYALFELQIDFHHL